jgi:hypothetical protein
LAILGGHIQLARWLESDEVDDCDRLASSLIDPTRQWRSMPFPVSNVDVRAATEACQRALQKNRRNPHYEYLVSRMTDDTSLAIDAAQSKYAAAFNELTYILEHEPSYKREDTDGSLHKLRDKIISAYVKSVYFTTFGVTFEFLKNHPRDSGRENDRNALEWLATKAADCGVPDGHMALAEFAKADADKWFHLRLAAHLLEKSTDGNEQEIEDLRSRADRIDLLQAEKERQQQRVDNWTVPDPLIELTPDDLTLLRADPS